MKSRAIFFVLTAWQAALPAMVFDSTLLIICREDGMAETKQTYYFRSRLGTVEKYEVPQFKRVMSFERGGRCYELQLLAGTRDPGFNSELAPEGDSPYLRASVGKRLEKGFVVIHSAKVLHPTLGNQLELVAGFPEGRSTLSCTMALRSAPEGTVTYEKADFTGCR